MFMTKMELAAFSDRQNDLNFRSLLGISFLVCSVDKKEIKADVLHRECN